MRYHTNAEQEAVHNSGVFVFGEVVVGRTWWPGPSGATERHYYRAELIESPGIWEIAIGEFDGAVLTRVTALISNGWGAVPADAPVRVAQIAPASAMWSIDAHASVDALPSASASGAAAMAAGVGADAWGDGAVAVGLVARVGGVGAERLQGVAIGAGAEVDHDGAVAIGGGARTRVVGGLHNYQGGVWWVGVAFTEDDSPVHLASNMGSAILLPENLALALSGTVVARREDADGWYSAEVKLLVRRGSGGAAVIVGTPSIVEIAESGGAALSVSVAVVGVDGEIAVQCTGAAAEQWTWSGSLLGAWA